MQIDAGTYVMVNREDYDTIYISCWLKELNYTGNKLLSKCDGNGDWMDDVTTWMCGLIRECRGFLSHSKHSTVYMSCKFSW